MLAASVFFVGQTQAALLPGTAKDLVANQATNLESASTFFFGYNDPRGMLIRVINIALLMFGIVIIGLISYAGYRFMTAGDDAEARKQAMHTIRNAVIGLALVLASYAMANFVFEAILNQRTPTSAPGTRTQNTNLIERECLKCLSLEGEEEERCIAQMEDDFRNASFDCRAGDYGGL